MQYKYQKTRRDWILLLQDSLRKVWFFMGGKWPWVKVFCWNINWPKKKIIEKNCLNMNRQYGALQQIL